VKCEPPGSSQSGAISRHAFRTLRAAPGFAAAAVATLALAIGANSAIFSVVSGILLRPLPYEQSDRLALIVREQTLVGAHQPVPAGFFAKEDADGWQHALRTFDMTALLERKRRLKPPVALKSLTRPSFQHPSSRRCAA
jgi:hypothetical protein